MMDGSDLSGGKMDKCSILYIDFKHLDVKHFHSLDNKTRKWRVTSLGTMIVGIAPLKWNLSQEVLDYFVLYENK